ASSSCPDRCGIQGTATPVPQAVRPNRAAVDRTGEVVAGAAAASAVLGAQRTAVDGTARLQSAVPLVRGLEHGRRHLGCDRVHQKPRAPARWGHCGSLLPSRTAAGTGAESALGRALHGGRNAAGGVGECEELSAQGCEERRSAGRCWQCDSRFPRGEAVQRDARIEDGPDPDAKMARKGKGKLKLFGRRELYDLSCGRVRTISFELFRALSRSSNEAACGTARACWHLPL